MGPRRLMAASLLIVSLVALPGLAHGRSVQPALAREPDTSIILYKPPANGKPGRAVTGTVVNGVFTKRKAFDTGRWSSIAVGRDSMALYDRVTGKLLTGRFRDGVWKPLKSRRIAKGYTHVVASCDTILFYKRSTGTGKTAEFTSGDIRDTRSLPNALGDHPLLAASCDTLMTIQSEFGVGSDPKVGWLRLGHWEEPDHAGFGASGTHLTANRGSFLYLDVPASGPAPGHWGLLGLGDLDFVDDAPDFARWDLIAGVGDSILFYIRSTGSTWISPLEDGVYGDGAQRPSIGKGWRIIAGGK